MTSAFLLAKRWRLVWLLIGSCVIAACGSHNDGPSSEQIAKALTFKLPAGVEVSDVRIEASQNIGSKVEPVFQTRSTVTLVFKDDFLKVVDNAGGKKIVQQTFIKGDTLSGMLISRATLKADQQWQLIFTKVDLPTVTGQAASQLAASSYVVKDSSEYQALMQEVAQQQQQARALAAQKAAEEMRQKAQRIATLAAQLQGTWAAKDPALHNGIIWVTRSGHKLGIELIIPSIEGTTGQGTGILYDFDAPASQTQAPITIALDPSGQFATVHFAHKLHLEDDVNFSTDSRDVWQITQQGLLSTGSSRNHWALQLERDGKALQDMTAKIAAHKQYVSEKNALLEKYNAANAEKSFSRLPLQNGQSGYFFVVGRIDQRVYGDGIYDNSSYVATTAVHAGLLKPGQEGIVKIEYHRIKKRTDFRGTTRHGVTSKQTRGYDIYKISLVKALPLDHA